MSSLARSSSCKTEGVQAVLRPDILVKGRWSRAGSGKSGGVRVIYFTRTSTGEVVLLALYSKAKTDNITGAKLKEIRRVLEE